VEKPAQVTAEDVQKALLNVLGKPAKEMMHVDLGQKLKDAGLATFFPLEVWVLLSAGMFLLLFGAPVTGLPRSECGSKTCHADPEEGEAGRGQGRHLHCR